MVEITDNGPGISTENQSHIFEPFLQQKAWFREGPRADYQPGHRGRTARRRNRGRIKGRRNALYRALPVRRVERNDSTEAAAASRAVMAELSERLEGREAFTEPKPAVLSEGAFATIFDVPLFARLDDSQRASLSTGTEVRFCQGDSVVREGAPSNYFCVMLEGELRATKFFDQGNLPGARSSRNSLARFRFSSTSITTSASGQWLTAASSAFREPGSGACCAPLRSWRGKSCGRWGRACAIWKAIPKSAKN